MGVPCKPGSFVGIAALWPPTWNKGHGRQAGPFIEGPSQRSLFQPPEAPRARATQPFAFPAPNPLAQSIESGKRLSWRSCRSGCRGRCF